MFDEGITDQYRWCIWCGVDCWLKLEDQVHSRSCPCSTGLYEVDNDLLEIYAKCPQSSCGKLLKDYYILVDFKTGEQLNNPDVAEVMCFDCAIYTFLLRRNNE